MATFADLLDSVAGSSDFNARLDQAKEAYKQRFGKDLPITSMVRTRAEQQRLFDEAKAGKPGIYMPTDPSKFPDKQTFHENAADIPTSVPESFLNEFGIHRPLGKKDPVHAVLMPTKPSAPTAATAKPAEAGTQAFGDWIDSLASKTEETKAEKTEPTLKGQTVGLVNKFLQFKKDLGASAASLLDVTVGGVIPGVAGPVTYAGARALGQSPEQAAAAEKKVVQTTESPFGKLLGVTQEPAYQGEASRQIMDFIGQNISKGADWIAKKTGLPVSDVQNMMGTALVGVVPATAKAVSATGKAIQTGIVEPAQRAAAELQVVKPGQAAPPQMGVAAPGVMTPGSVAQMQQQFAARQGASVGAAGADVTSRIRELATRLPENEAQKLLAADPKTVDLAAAERRATAHKFGLELTQGEAKQNLAMLGDEFNAKRELPELQTRLTERSNKLFQGLDQIKERTAPDIFTSNKVDLGQSIIDTLQAKDAARRQEISGLYKKLEEANAGALPIDTGALLNNIEATLSKKMRSRYAPAELIDTIRDAAKRGSMTFEEFENLRSIAAEDIRSSKDGNRRMAASIIRDELENMPLSTQNAQIKALADQARKAAKARFDLIESNPAYKAAVRDTRSAADLASGLESVGADKFLDQFIHSDTKAAATANVKRLMAELSDQPQAIQALRAGTIEHLREKATQSGGYFNQAGYNKRMAALNKKVDQIFAGDPSLVDLKDLGQVASWTEHVKPLSGANVTESGNVVLQGIRKAAETGIQAKTGVPVGMIKGYFEGKKRETQLKKMIEPGAGIIND